MRWAIGCMFSMIGILLLGEGLKLKSLGTEVDGDGIGVYFWGIKINDHVSEIDIPSYANGFLGVGTILLILAICLFFILLKRKTAPSNQMQKRKV
jgi:hypothetical protein